MLWIISSFESFFISRAADKAVRLAHARKKDAHVVVNFRDRRHGRARVVGARLLVDRYGGREAGYLLDIGLLHLAEELPRISGQRFDIAALALGKNSVERQRRLPASRKPREYHHLIPRNGQRNVLKIVSLCPFYSDVVFHGVLMKYTNSSSTATAPWSTPRGIYERIYYTIKEETPPQPKSRAGLHDPRTGIEYGVSALWTGLPSCNRSEGIIVLSALRLERVVGLTLFRAIAFLHRCS